MPQDRAPRRNGNRVPVREAAFSGVPSPVAQARLYGALRDRAEAYRHDATVDLTIVEALLKLDEPEAAAKTLDEHRASLHAMARDLQVAVADAAVEREAERVWEACANELQPPAPAASRGLRRRVLTMTGAAAMALMLLLPAGRLSPRTMLASVEQRSGSNDLAAARERLEAARTAARTVREEHAELKRSALDVSAQSAKRTARQDVVRHTVRAILAADDNGGSAAKDSASAKPADVADLDDYRARRGSGGTGSNEPDAPADDDRPEADVVPLDVQKQVPQAEDDLGVDAPETDGVPPPVDDVPLDAVPGDTDER